MDVRAAGRQRCGMGAASGRVSASLQAGLRARLGISQWLGAAAAAEVTASTAGDGLLSNSRRKSHANRPQKMSVTITNTIVSAADASGSALTSLTMDIAATEGGTSANQPMMPNSPFTAHRSRRRRATPVAIVAGTIIPMSRMKMDQNIVRSARAAGTDSEVAMPAKAGSHRETTK